MRLLKLFGLFLIPYFSVVLLVTNILTDPFLSRISKISADKFIQPNMSVNNARTAIGRGAGRDGLRYIKSKYSTAEMREQDEEFDEILDAL